MRNGGPFKGGWKRRKREGWKVGTYLKEVGFEEFVRRASIAEVVQHLNALVDVAEPPARQRLERVLLERTNFDAITKQFLVGYAATLTLTYGDEGLRRLAQLVVEAPERPYPSAILDVIYCAGRERHSKFALSPISVVQMLRTPPITHRMAALAGELFRDLIVQSQRDPNLFRQFVAFLGRQANQGEDEGIVTLFFETIRESTIALSRATLAEFENLIASDLKEEIYQRFLGANPVLLDPLARQVILKQQLGVEMVTDFVIARLDNTYILVEIEKPQDQIFTRSDDFTRGFSHALGQVLGFQEWIESNIAYAQKLLPGVVAPVGLLVIGRRGDLTDWQRQKLSRFNINNNGRMRVLCFDDILESAVELRRNLHPDP